MKTSRKGFYWVSAIVVFVVTGILLIFLSWRQKPNQPVLIGREQAIQNAIQACNPGYGLQLVEAPTVFETEITTYEKALGFVPIPSKAKRPVWVVTMKKGRWLLMGGPQADPSASDPGPFYWHECTQIIDAQTGEWLSYPIE